MKKSTTYRQTFRRHRLLLSVPIVIAVFIAGALSVMSAKSYMSTASLWVDSPATSDSSLGNLNPALTPPSTQEQNVLTELLATDRFALAVAHHSSLGSYLASHSGGGIPIIGGGGGSLDARILAALAPPAVATSVPGPQVLAVSYSGPTPAIAQSTLQAIVAQLQQQSSLFSQQHSQSAIEYYKGQVDTATQTLLATRNQANAYRAQHPSAQPGDPDLAAFQTAETSAGTELSQAQAGLSAAEAALKGGSAVAQVRVIDSADFPGGPTSGKKKQVEGIMAGLVAGLLISFLGTIALTRRESDPWEDELAELAGPVAQAVPPVVAAQPGDVPSHRHAHGAQPHAFARRWTPAEHANGNGVEDARTAGGGPLTYGAPTAHPAAPSAGRAAGSG